MLVLEAAGQTRFRARFAPASEFRSHASRSSRSTAGVQPASHWDRTSLRMPRAVQKSRLMDESVNGLA